MVPLIATAQTALSKVILAPGFSALVTEHSADFWREMSAVR